MPSTLDKPAARPVPTFSPESWLLPPLQPLTKLPPNYRTGRPPRPGKPPRISARARRKNLNKHGTKEVRAKQPETKPQVHLTTIRLYGVLGKKYGRVWKLDVANVGEAIVAIDAQRPGFRKALADMDQGFSFLVRVGKRKIREQELPMYTLGKTICITPVARGSGGPGLWETIGGVVLAVVGVVLMFTPLAAFGPALIIGGIGLIIGGIAALIAGTPQTDTGKHQTSYQFSTAENIAVQGAPCALAYGYPYCGSIVESSSIVNGNYRTGTIKTPNKTTNSNTIGGLFTEEKGDGTMITVDGPGAGVGGSQLSDGTISGTGGTITGGGDAGPVIDTGSATDGSTNTSDGGSGGGVGGGGGNVGGGPVLAEYYPQRSLQERREALGAGGGSSSGSGAKEDPDTLSSRQYAAIEDIICEGPIQGLGNGEQSVYFDRTPVQNPDGTYNFEDYEIHFVSGRQDQANIPGFDSEEATQAEGFQLRQDFPYVREIENPNLDAIRVSVQVPKLETQDSHNGNITGAHVQLTVELNIGGQGWVQMINDSIVGKASNPYTRDYIVNIPANNRPGTYQIRVTRITDDSTSQLLANDTYVESLTQIVYINLRSPNTVKCGIKINAEQFSNIPVRTYRVYGLLVNIPSNYDPVAGVYTGDWDGTFQTAWTCNPAWILFDLILNNRYGLGNYINFGNTDKWAFYRAGVYCDEMVPDGFGGTEHRYECHAYIAGRQDAMQVISDICGIFRAAAAYIGGQIIPVLDKFVDPTEYAGQFTPDNVVNGDFAFANSSRKARHTVALVTWNDPTQNGDAQVEYVENSSQVHRYGIRELNVTALGCYSRGQAHRTGLWLLLTEQYRTEVCTFKTLLEGATLRPGDIIEISAPFRAGRTMSGRINTEQCTQNTVALDGPVTILEGSTYQISIGDANGKLVQMNVANPPGTYTTLNLTNNLLALPSQDSVWILIASTLVPELFRVQTVNMIDTATVEITAISYNPSLYDAVDLGTPLDTYPTTNLPSANTCLPPTNLTINLRSVVEPTGVTQVLEATWGASPDAFFKYYGVAYRIGNGNWIDLPNSNVAVADVPIQYSGTYEFSITAYNALGGGSLPITGSYAVDGGQTPVDTSSVTGLELAGQANDTNWSGLDAKFDWRLNSPAAAQEIGDETNGASNGAYDPMFKDYQVNILDAITGAQVWQEYVATPTYTFTYTKNGQAFGTPRPQFTISVCVRDIFNNISAPCELTVNNPPPNPPTGLVVTPAFKNNFVEFIPSTDLDLQATLVLVSTTGNLADAITYNAGTGSTWVHSGVVTGTTYTYWVQSQDTFGNLSNVFPSTGAGVSVTPGSIQATDIAAFAINATGAFGNTVVLQGDEWGDHDPTPLAISWNAHTIFWQGTAYPIAAGNTTDQYVYWNAGDAAYSTSQTNPADTEPGWLNNNHFQICINVDNTGVHELAWYGFANAVIGSAFIGEAAITNAKIGTAAVDTLTLAGQAVTIPVATTFASVELSTAGIVAGVYIAELTVISTGAPALISVSWGHAISALNATQTFVRVVRGDGTYLYSSDFTTRVGTTELQAITMTDPETLVGASTYGLQICVCNNANGPYYTGTARTPTITYLETKR